MSERQLLEVRFEPADPGWTSRAWRFVGLRGGALLAALAAYLVFLAVGIALIVPAATAALTRREYDGLLGERSVQGERLQSLLATLRESGERSRSLRTRLARVRWAYGLESDRPVEAAEPRRPPSGAPESIYAGVITRGAADAVAIAQRLEEITTLLAVIEAHELGAARRARTTPSISPIAGSRFILTTAFGTRRNPFTRQIEFHAGIDLAAPVGTPIRAPADGVVAFTGRYPLRIGITWWRFGNMVALRSGKRFISLFGHCDEIRVRSGQSVRQGELLATVGNSGWSTNPHLHYEVRVADPEGTLRPVDPRLLVFDHDWPDEEQILLRALEAAVDDFEPLPRAFKR